MSDAQDRHQDGHRRQSQDKPQDEPQPRDIPQDTPQKPDDPTKPDDPKSDPGTSPQDGPSASGPLASPSAGKSAVRAWAASGIVVALCVVVSLAALWVFDVIDLPGLGRFAGRAGSVPTASSSSSRASRPSEVGAFGGNRGGDGALRASDLGRRLSQQGSWPARTGARPVDGKALSDATHDFLSHTGSPAKEGYAIANGDGTVVSSSNAGALLEPASTMKTLTTLAATGVLDMDSTLDTDVVLLDGHQDAVAGAATIVLRGGGDMLLSSGSSDPSHVNGHAGLATLAGRTAAALSHKRITAVRLVADTTFFGAARRPSTMTEDYVQTGYFTPTAALAIDEGRQPVPGSDPDSADRSTIPRTDDPAPAAVSSFASALSAALTAKGIRLTNTASAGKPRVDAATAEQRRQATSRRSVRVARVSSAPLRQILGLMLRLSDNTLAEEFGRLTALRLRTGNSPEGAVKAVRQELARQHIDLTGATIADCSGLSPGSRISPTMLFHVMRRLRTHAEASAFEGLPVITEASTDFPSESLGRVRLKSGSLDEVTSDSGVILRTNGGFFYYAAIVNVEEGQWGPRGEGLSAIHRLAGRLVSM